MARLERFTFTLTSQEKKVIADMAERLKRSQSDAVRVVVFDAARKLGLTNEVVIPLFPEIQIPLLITLDEPGGQCDR